MDIIPELLMRNNPDLHASLGKASMETGTLHIDCVYY